VDASARTGTRNRTRIVAGFDSDLGFGNQASCFCLLCWNVFATGMTAVVTNCGRHLFWAIFFVIAGRSTFAIVIENFVAKLSLLMPVLLRL